MDKKKYWIIRLFFVFFTLSVSIAILPCGTINIYGLFAEVTTSVVVDDKDQEVAGIKTINQEKVKIIKNKNILNVWFEILIAVVCISFLANLAKLPRGETIVTLKVRIDD